MTEVEVDVPNRLGLHARAAARFVHAANGFEARIVVRVVPAAGEDGAAADGKSILGLLTLAAAHGSRLRLSADGVDEQKAVDTLARLVESGFGEGAA